MKGYNEMMLNEATMIEAVQQWIDSKWRVGMVVPTVTGVSQEGGDIGRIGKTFKIMIDADASMRPEKT